MVSFHILHVAVTQTNSLTSSVSGYTASEVSVFIYV